MKMRIRYFDGSETEHEPNMNVCCHILYTNLCFFEGRDELHGRWYNIDMSTVDTVTIEGGRRV